MNSVMPHVGSLPEDFQQAKADASQTVRQVHSLSSTEEPV